MASTSNTIAVPTPPWTLPAKTFVALCITPKVLVRRHRYRPLFAATGVATFGSNFTAIDDRSAGLRILKNGREPAGKAGPLTLVKSGRGLGVRLRRPGHAGRARYVSNKSSGEGRSVIRSGLSRSILQLVVHDDFRFDTRHG